MSDVAWTRCSHEATRSVRGLLAQGTPHLLPDLPDLPVRGVSVTGTPPGGPRGSTSFPPRAQSTCSPATAGLEGHLKRPHALSLPSRSGWTSFLPTPSPPHPGPGQCEPPAAPVLLAPRAPAQRAEQEAGTPAKSPQGQTPGGHSYTQGKGRGLHTLSACCVHAICPSH